MNRIFRLALEAHTLGLNLYHYSGARHSVLKTREKTAKTIEKKKLEEAKESMEIHHDPGTYYQHISFFFDPVPLDVVGRIFGKEHPFWYPGHEIYEHVVSLDHMPDFKYRIVETPLANKMFYDTDWDELDDSDKLMFFRKLAEAQKAHGEIGHSAGQFRSVASEFVGKARKAFEELPKQPNWGEIKKQYAATVPHVMLYPKGGEVKVDKITEVKIAQ